MALERFIGKDVTLFLQGGHTITARVTKITHVDTTDSMGRLVMQPALVLSYNGHTALVCWDKVDMIEL